MTTIVTRAGKGTPLTHTEMDANLTNLNNDKAETTALANMLETTDIGVSVQAYSANLGEYAAVNPTTAGLALLDDADAATQRATLGLVIGTDVEAHDPDLTTIAGLSPTNDDFLQRKSGAWANRSVSQVQADLGITPLPSQTGNTDKVLKTDGSATSWGSSVILGTSQALTSGTSKYWDIPSWANEFSLSWDSMILSGSAARIRIGTSGGPVSSGYKGGWMTLSSGGTNYSTLSAYLPFNYSGEHSGKIIFHRVSGNIWSFTGTSGATGNASQGGYIWTGTIDAGATLTRVWLESTDGVATFTAGTANTTYS